MNKWTPYKKSRTQRGASLIEYSLLLALITVTCITGIRTISLSLRKSFCGILNAKSSDQLTAAEWDGTGKCRGDDGSGGFTDLF